MEENGSRMPGNNDRIVKIEQKQQVNSGSDALQDSAEFMAEVCASRIQIHRFNFGLETEPL